MWGFFSETCSVSLLVGFLICFFVYLFGFFSVFTALISKTLWRRSNKQFICAQVKENSSVKKEIELTISPWVAKWILLLLIILQENTFTLAIVKCLISNVLFILIINCTDIRNKAGEKRKGYYNIAFTVIFQIKSIWAADFSNIVCTFKKIIFHSVKLYLRTTI